MIWKLALNAELCMECIQYHYDIPTDTITFWGTHVLHILTVDFTFNTFDNPFSGLNVALEVSSTLS